MRKLIRPMIAGTVILFVAGAAAYAQSTTDKPQNEIEARANVAIPTGEANFSGTTNSGSTVDFARDVNFNNKIGFDLRYIRRSKNDKHKLMFQYNRDNWDKSSTTTRTITFAGQTFAANTSADLDVTIRTFRGMYAYRFGNDKIRFGPMVDMGVIDTNVRFTGTIVGPANSGTRTSEGSISKFAATIGYDLEATPAPHVMIFSDLGAIAYQGEHFFHFEAGMKYYFTTHFGALGGYRLQQDKLVDGNNFVLIKQHGPFFGGLFRF